MMSGGVKVILVLISVGCIIECGGSYAGKAPTEAPTTPSSSYGGGGGGEAPSPTDAPSAYGGNGGAAPSPTDAPSAYGGNGGAAPAPSGGSSGGNAGTIQALTAVSKPKGRRCYPNAQRFGKCRQLCRCSSDGSKWECFRQRKEFTTMTRREKKRFIEAYRELSRSSCPYNKLFDKLITSHKENFMTSIHQKKHFLTWHRYFLLQIENLLQKIDCRITLPYWDWSASSGDPWGTDPEDLWYSGNTGFGGNGDPTNGYCVKSGPFSVAQDWKPVSSNLQGCNRRVFRGNPPDAVAILELLETAPVNFTDFEMELRVIFHDPMHCYIGGTMCSLDSASAPEFFLHHGFIDKIWDDWQQKSEKHRNVFFYDLTEHLPGTDLLPRDVVDNANLPGDVKLEYLEINDTETKTLRNRLRRLSRKQLRELRRPDFEDVDEDAMKLFNVPFTEKAKARRRGRRFRPKNKKNRKLMKSRRARRRGFDLDDLQEVENRKSKSRDRARYKVQGMRIKPNRNKQRRPNAYKARRPKEGKQASGRTRRPGGSSPNSGSRYGGGAERRPKVSPGGSSPNSGSKYGGGAERRPKVSPGGSSPNGGSKYGGGAERRPKVSPGGSSSKSGGSKYGGGAKGKSSSSSSSGKSSPKSVSRYSGSRGGRPTRAPRKPTKSTSASGSSNAGSKYGNKAGTSNSSASNSNTQAPSTAANTQAPTEAPTTTPNDVYGGGAVPTTEAPNVYVVDGPYGRQAPQANIA